MSKTILICRSPARVFSLLSFLAGMLSLQCTGPGPTGSDEIDVAITPLPGGGFNDAGVQSSIPNFLFEDSWFFIPGFGDDSCTLGGRCSAGGNVNRFSGLTAPFNPEAIPGNDGNPSLTFAFISTQNFLDPFNNVAITVLKSGIQKTGIAISKLPGTLELKFDYAFLAGDYNTGPAHNDFAQILLLDQNNRTLATVLRMERNALQPGGSGPVSSIAHPAPPGCGPHTLASVVANYSLCTDWLTHSFDLNPFKGQTVTLRVLAEEAGGKNEHPVTLLYDNFRIVHAR